MLAAQSCLTLCDPMDGKASLPVEFSREEYWSGLPFPSPGDLPKPGIKSGSPILQADSLPSERYQGSFLLSLNWKGEEEKRKGKGKKRKDCFWWIFHVQNCELPMCIGLHKLGCSTLVSMENSLLESDLWSDTHTCQKGKAVSSPSASRS